MSGQRHASGHAIPDIVPRLTLLDTETHLFIFHADAAVILTAVARRTDVKDTRGRVRRRRRKRHLSKLNFIDSIRQVVPHDSHIIVVLRIATPIETPYTTKIPMNRCGQCVVEWMTPYFHKHLFYSHAAVGQRWRLFLCAVLSVLTTRCRLLSDQEWHVGHCARHANALCAVQRHRHNFIVRRRGHLNVTRLATHSAAIYRVIYTCQTCGSQYRR